MLRVNRSILVNVIFIMVLATLAESCRIKEGSPGIEEKREQSVHSPVAWSRDAVLYEVNIRQYTPEGTLSAFMEHLPRLKELGVDILWLMPIHPIGEKKRKGPLGSYYSISDYRAVNPEFGSMDDLKELVKKAHEMDMKVLLDWVANHTAWDHPWIEEHPDWYTTNDKGKVIAPDPDWTDVADLNFDNMAMREAMIRAMEYWVKEADIDGYRCDVAWGVPVDFWEETRERLDEIKPVFMLAEAAEADLLVEAFDMCYGWEFHHLMNEAAEGEEIDFNAYFEKVDTVYGADDYIMNFITNHDENSWAGTEFDRMGQGVAAFAVLTYTVPGMPLIYSGQEVGFDKELEFFKKDLIDWTDNGWTEFYRKLNAMKKDLSVLRHGDEGAPIEILTDPVDYPLFTFKRQNEEETLLAVFNFSPEKQQVNFDLQGSFVNYLKEGQPRVDLSETITLDPWGYKVLLERE